MKTDFAAVSDEVIQWCNSHPGCKGCPFVGSECVAPVSDHNFSAWVRKMNGIISEVSDA